MLIRSLAVTVVAFILWSILIGLLPQDFGWELSQRSENRVRGEDFLYAPPPAADELVMVGSSLSALFPADSLAGRRVHRLSFGGLSVLDGLALLETLTEPPAMVLVEANLLDKDQDEAFARQLLQPVSRSLKKHLPALRHRHQPVLVLMGGLFYLKNGLPDSDPPVNPTPPLNETLLALQRVSYAKVPARAERMAKIKAVAARLEALRKRGIRIALFEAPVHPDLCASPRAKDLRTILDLNFPEGKYDRWLAPDCTAYDTYDGHHLSEASAIAYTHELDAWVKTLLHE